MSYDYLREEEERRSQEEAEKRRKKEEEKENNDKNDFSGLLAIIGFVFILIIILALIGSISGNDNSNTSSTNTITKIEENIVIESNVSSSSDTNYIIDYEEKDFEDELNSDNLEMIGKIVKFSVKEYHPESKFGDNCWSGEHLNFISEEEVNANKGDVIVGKITKKPYKFLGVWIVHYELISNNVNANNGTNNAENNI